MQGIQMVDLKTQYAKIKDEIQQRLFSTLDSGAFINGPEVHELQASLEKLLDVKHAIPCANGTDALQIAMMSLGLEPGDEVIVPAFTYVATAEVIGLLRLTPVMVDVDPHTFNVRAEDIKSAVTARTKAIVPVHLFGQSCDMESILQVSQKYGLYIIEDNAQSLSTNYQFMGGRLQKTGTIGDIGCTSFYPSKNLGAFGDAGAIFTNNSELAERMRTIANHGQRKRYYHDIIGINSRLDSMQAVVLNVKLKQFANYIKNRQEAAKYYDEQLDGIEGLQIPKRQYNSSHVYHQYTLQVANGKRDALQAHLKSKGIPSMIYYPLALFEQPAFQGLMRTGSSEFENTKMLCKSVLSLPMHSELNEEQLAYICKTVQQFFA